MFFKFTTGGESHGKALVAIVEGVPAGLPINVADVDHELRRRQQGYGRGGRMKIETDKVEILSGVRHGHALGSPIALMINNDDFVHWKEVMAAEPLEVEPKNPRLLKRPRPGHADLAGGQKYQARDLRNILERASARETAARVACGSVARQLLVAFGIEIRSHVIKIGHIQIAPLARAWEEVEAIPADSPLNCADETAQDLMIKLIDQTKKAGDTLGGIFEVIARGLPVGLGSHTSWSEKLDGRLAQALMSIHAIKAVEIGNGVANAGKPGSEVHDEIFYAEPSPEAPGGFYRQSNRAGGLEGGITNGEELRVRGYMKPISTLRSPLHSVDIDTKESSEAAFERSDITAVPAAGVIGEAMVAIVLANAMREKFGGDSLAEMRRNFDGYSTSVREF
ncbi:MAG TPA: chorismate synthase [Pyrinomonadaceae bacterium]|nr:chorismate synthase [Pyrinomonadaceae bacterium]